MAISNYKTPVGYYSSMIINTRGKGFPKYLSEFFAEKIKSSGDLFYIVAIYEQTTNFKFWKSSYPDISDTDTLYQIVCAFSTPLKEREFEEYMNLIMYSDVIPFVDGCGFSFYGMYFMYSIPSELKNIGSGGDYSVVLKTAAQPNALRIILKEMFSLDNFTIQEALVRISASKSYRIPKCLGIEGVHKFKKFMDEAEIGYEIEL